jgi:uncharacterized protein YfbU (UPF0304 family)
MTDRLIIAADYQLLEIQNEETMRELQAILDKHLKD